MIVHVCNLVQEVETRDQKVKAIRSYTVGSSPTWYARDEVSKRDVFNWKIRTIHSRHGWWLTPVIPVPRRLKQRDCPKFKASLHYKVRQYLNTYPSPEKKKQHIYKSTRELITWNQKKWIFVEPIHITEWGQQPMSWHNPSHFKCPTWQCHLLHFTRETKGGSRAMDTGRGWWEGSAGEIPYWVGSLELRWKGENWSPTVVLWPSHDCRDAWTPTHNNNFKRAGEMAQCMKGLTAQAWKPEFDPQNPRDK